MSIDLNAPLAAADPEIFTQIQNEIHRQHDGLEMIASENFVSRAVLEAVGTVFTNKYAEGYPGKRYYGGCEHADVVENLARDRAKQLFGAEHANVQPHSGSQANAATFMTLLTPGDTILGLDLAHGGHLTHGHKLNFSGKLYRVCGYQVRRDTETIDYDELEDLATREKPKVIIGGGSAYARQWDFPRMRQIADKVDAKLVVDMAHFAGLVAGGAHPSPVPHAHVTTTTTHKTLRGPRSGLILCEQQFAAGIDRSVFPGQQGGPLVHVIAGKAVAFREALEPDFTTYAHQVVANARALAAAVIEAGYRVVSGGTDTHLVLVDVFQHGMLGSEAENALGAAGITVNKNAIPYDTNPPLKPSGIRLGTPALTTRGMKEPEMTRIAGWIVDALEHRATPPTSPTSAPKSLTSPSSSPSTASSAPDPRISTRGEVVPASLPWSLPCPATPALISPTALQPHSSASAPACAPSRPSPPSAGPPTSVISPSALWAAWTRPPRRRRPLHRRRPRRVHRRQAPQHPCNRTSALGLIGRLTLGGLVGAIIATALRRPILGGIALGALGAVAGTYGGFYARRGLTHGTGPARPSCRPLRRCQPPQPLPYAPSSA